MASPALAPLFDPRPSPPDTTLSVSEVVSAAEWDGYVRRHPDASGYHLWTWRHVFEQAFGHRTIYLAARQRGRVTGVLPLVHFDHVLFGRFMVSLPFVTYGGVLASSDEAARALLDRAAELASTARLSHIELRHVEPRFPDLHARHHKVTMMLPLAPTVDRTWTGLDRKVRNLIRKAQRSDLLVQMGGRELVGHFYDVFSRNMRDLGSPVYSRRFFDEIVEQFPDDTRVFAVWLWNRPVAAGITYAFGRTLEMPWASSLRQFRHVCPNYLLYWAVLQYAVEQGFERFDFGRSTPDEGPYHFKKQWGAQPIPLAWEYRLIAAERLPDRSPRNPKLAPAIALWKRLPLWMTLLLGPQVVRYIP